MSEIQQGEIPEAPNAIYLNPAGKAAIKYIRADLVPQEAKPIQEWPRYQSDVPALSPLLERSALPEQPPPDHWHCEICDKQDASVSKQEIPTPDGGTCQLWAHPACIETLPKVVGVDRVDFGSYVQIEQFRYGVASEQYQYKVIGRMKSNYWVEVPVRADGVERLHRESADVIACICCGIDETRVTRFQLSDVGIISTAREVLPGSPSLEDMKLLDGIIKEGKNNGQVMGGEKTIAMLKRLRSTWAGTGQ